MQNDINKNMSCNLLILIKTLLCLSVIQRAVNLTEAYHKFVYQKDMSQHCRRQVMPSVFLGRQVVDAYSQTLHFSRLEVPYSCFVNVRTEMGNNIIVVIQVNNDEDLEKSCSEGASQLIIYEIAETFGGYWGPIPSSMMKRDRHGHREFNKYTLRPNTTVPSTTTTISTVSSTTTASPQRNKTKKEKEAQELPKEEYLTVELPIVNVSAEIVLEDPLHITSTTQDQFDFNVGVTPWRQIVYDSRIVPIVEIDFKKQKSARVGDDNTNIYEIDYNPAPQVQFDDLFTPDWRLTLPTFDKRNYRRKSYKFKPRENKLLNFGKNKNLFVPKDISFYRNFPITQHQSQLGTLPANIYLTTVHHTTKLSTKNFKVQKENKINSWKEVHDILKKLSDHKDTTTESPHQELANILRRVANTEFNKSVYLAPKRLSLTTPRLVITEPKNDLDVKTTEDSNYNESNNTWERHSTSSESYISSNILNSLIVNKSTRYKVGNIVNKSTRYKVGNIVALLPLQRDVDNIILNVSNNNKDEDKVSKAMADAISTTIKREPVAVSLVDRESWENVVKIAPVMAVMLKKTNLTSPEKKHAEHVTKPTKSKVRKKRFIHAIDIEIAKPHQLHEKEHSKTTPAPVIFKIRELQRLIEMQDDEIYGRVSMRNLRSFIGPPLLNFCTLNMTSNRHVYLFNSSRILLAISNFTLKRMTVVVTPAHTLLDYNERCPAQNLECQMSGARVCIDSLSACDGVPNCGSYDIYDEDRLQCGAATGLRHNISLAAMTFMAAVLTIIYTIHYWLKRCVPKVSKAFFIYTDAAENELYIETIMQSPHDIGPNKFIYREEERELGYADIDIKENSCKRFMDMILIFFRCRGRKVSEDVDAIEKILALQECSEKLSSFAKTEIDKMALGIPSLGTTSEIAVQTDYCFGIKETSPTEFQEANLSENKNVNTTSDSSELMNQEINSNQASDELFMLKFLRGERGRSISMQLNPMENILMSQLSDTKVSNDSKQIQNELTLIDSEINKDIKVELSNKSTEICEDEYSDKPVVKKQLRFQDGAEVIPNLSDDEIEENLQTTTNITRQSVMLGVNRVPHHNEVEEPSFSTGRELKSYFNWGSAKEKKKKKIKKK